MNTQCTCSKDGFYDSGAVNNYGCPVHDATTPKSVEEIVEELFQSVMDDVGKHYRVSDKLCDVLSDALTGSKLRTHLTTLLAEREAEVRREERTRIFQAITNLVEGHDAVATDSILRTMEQFWPANR